MGLYNTLAARCLTSCYIFLIGILCIAKLSHLKRVVFRVVTFYCMFSVWTSTHEVKYYSLRSREWGRFCRCEVIWHACHEMFDFLLYFLNWNVMECATTV